MTKKSEDHSSTSTGIRFVRLAPALIWVPRWFRYNLTLQHVLGFIAVVFCGGVGWAHWHLESKMDENQKALQAALALQTQELAHISSELKDQKDWRTKIETEYEKPVVLQPPPLLVFPQH